jgi:hypothetical protein
MHEVGLAAGMIDKDPALCAIVAAMRRFNSTGRPSDAQRLSALASAYRQSTRPLDAEAAIRELLEFGSSEAPCEVSAELRYALARFLAGKITKKRGPKRAPPTAAIAQAAAVNARLRHRDGMPMDQAIAKEAAHAHISQDSISAIIYPRKSRRKT